MLNIARTACFGRATLTGAEVAQEVDEYLDALTLLQEALPQHAFFFEHMRQRLAE